MRGLCGVHSYSWVMLGHYGSDYTPGAYLASAGDKSVTFCDCE
jgi:hypothetical protein